MLVPIPPGSDPVISDFRVARDSRALIPQSRQIYQLENRAAISGGSLLADSWRTVSRHWRLVLVVILAGFLGTAIITIFQTPTYRAFALLEVRPLNGEFMDMKTVDPTSSGTSDPAEADVQTQIRVIESQPVMIRTMERMKAYTKGHTTKVQSYWSGMLSGLGLVTPESLPLSGFLKDVEHSMRVRSVGATRIVQITAESPDPFLAQLYVNMVVDEFRAQTAAAREMNSSATADWLASQLKTLKTDLRKAQNNLEQFARGNSLMFLDESSQATGPSVAQQRLQSLQLDFAHAQAERIAKQAAVEQTASQNQDSLPPVLDSGPIRDYELKLADLRRQLAEVSSTLKPSHPIAIRIQNQINELMSTVEREKSNVVGRMRTEFGAAQRREDLLQMAYTRQSGVVAEQQAKLVRYDELRSEVQSNQQLFDAMQRKVTEAHIAAALHASPIRVVNPAMLPTQVASPNWPLNLVAGFAGSMLLGIGISFVIEGSDKTIRAPGEAASQLDLKELGAIPKAHAEIALFNRLPSSHSQAKPHLDNGPRPTYLGDSFRSTVQSLLFAAADGLPLELIAVTSPEPGDGKSSVVTHLARALSEFQKSVLLIDCDLRRPALHKNFGVSNERGLTDLLNGGGAMDTDEIIDHILPTRLSRVSLLTAGSTPDNIPLTLTGERMRRLLKFAKESFDMVIVDCPPILQGPDARIMGKASDGLILVVRASKTTFAAAQSARALLEQDNTAMLGVILNDWNPTHAGYYSNYRSYYKGA